jgi:hypothetical protein
MKSKSNLLSACICRLALLLVFLLLFFSLSEAKTVTLGWDPNDEPDLEGYIVYRSVDSPGPPFRYSDELSEEDLDNPLSPRVTLTGLQENKKYFVAVTAYDTEGNESNFSKDVCFQIIDSAVSICSSSAISSNSSSAILGAGSGSGGGAGGGGGGCFISTAGLTGTGPIFLPFFISRQFEAFFAVLFLFFILAAKSVLPVVINYIKINKEK